MALFDLAAVFTDLHLGKRSDSPVHNADCLDFIEWFCDQASARKVDRIIFAGDWFDNRSRIRLDTLDASNKAMNMLLDVAPVELVVGNHDMFYRHNRDIHSLSIFDRIDGVRVHDTVNAVDGVGFVPYLVGTEYLEVLDLDAKYLFGHFELPTFLMNSTIEMPDRGQFNADQFSKPEAVFSGHFHQRQLKKNTNGIPVWYMGSPFGHDFNDVNDKERGMMFLEWGGQPEYVNWEQGPLYQRFTTEQIMDMIEAGNLANFTRPTSILEVKDTMGLELEDISVLREELGQHVREARMQAMAQTPGMDGEADLTDMDNKTIDEIVIDHLSDIDPRGSDIEPDYLVKLFKGD